MCSTRPRALGLFVALDAKELASLPAMSDGPSFPAEAALAL